MNVVVEGLRDTAEGEGDLTKRLDTKAKDELGQLAKWFNVFIDKLQGIMSDISGNSSGSSAGRWRFEPALGNWNLLNAGSGGQMSNSPTGTLYTNINNSVRTFDPVSGQAGATNILTTSAAIWDFTSGFN